MKEFAEHAAKEISKDQLHQIYSLFEKSVIPSDIDEIFKWCNDCCKAPRSTQSPALNKKLLFDYFEERIRDPRMKLDVMPLVGFEFIKEQFQRANKDAGNISDFKPLSKRSNQRPRRQDDDPIFDVNVDPERLLNLDIMWKIALHSQVEAVASKSIGFLLNCYLSQSKDRALVRINSRNKVTWELIKSIFDKMTEFDSSPAIVKRLVRILTKLIEITEKKGVRVKPHSAILKGELLERIIVRYMIKDRQGLPGRFIKDSSIYVSAFSSVTVWEFKE